MNYIEVIKRALDALGNAIPPPGEKGMEYDDVMCDLARIVNEAESVLVQQSARVMTAERAEYFMLRFKKEEKLLGPNEQAALDFVIDMLATPPAQPAVPIAELVDILNEASESICASARQPLGDELRGFALMLDTAPVYGKPK